MKSEKKLLEAGIRTFLPTLKQFEERHKSNLPDFGEKYDVKVPFSKPITSQRDIQDLKKDFEYPLMVKGKFYDAYLAYNEEQVRMHYNKITAKWGLPVIIQEFIRGTEVNVVALGDVDDDGAPDVFAGSFDQGYQVWHNDGAGPFGQDSRRQTILYWLVGGSVVILGLGVLLFVVFRWRPHHHTDNLQ